MGENENDEASKGKKNSTKQKLKILHERVMRRSLQKAFCAYAEIQDNAWTFWTPVGMKNFISNFWELMFVT